MLGISCSFCVNSRMTPWEKLSSDDQDHILQYFSDHEQRRPDTSAIIVCRQCNTVFDDFSGRTEPMWRAVHRDSTTRCKVCSRLVSHCDPKNHDIRCNVCHMHYAWRLHEQSGYRILMPPEGTSVLEKWKETLHADI